MDFFEEHDFTVDRFVISGGTAEALLTAKELFEWKSSDLIDGLAEMYDPDDDELFDVCLTPEDPEITSFKCLRVRIDPKDVINVDDYHVNDWIPVKVFSKLCSKYHLYGFKDVLFADWKTPPEGEITGASTRYAVGFFSDVDEPGVYKPVIKAAVDSVLCFEPTYCKLIKY